MTSRRSKKNNRAKFIKTKCKMQAFSLFEGIFTQSFLKYHHKYSFYISLYEKGSFEVV